MSKMWLGVKVLHRTIFLWHSHNDKNILQYLFRLYEFICYQFSSVAQLCLTFCDPMNRSTPGLPVHHQLLESYPNPCPLSQRCHPTISSSVVPFSSCPQSFPGSFLMSQLFTSGGRGIGALVQHQSFQ